jgi:phage I-like protein
MPLPTPESGETRNEFLNRCMINETVKKEFPDNEQRTAVCISQWEKKLSDSYLLADGEPKGEIMLFPFGIFHHSTYGKLDFTEDFHTTVVKNFENGVLGTEPFMDIEHKMGEALGWFKELVYRPGMGTFAKIEYTDKGNELLSSKTYKYFSPWFEDFKDPQTQEVHKNVFRGGAATNIPFLKMMPPIVDEGEQLSDRKVVNVLLSDIYTEAQSDSTTSEDVQTSGSSESDNNKMEVQMDELRKKLIKLYDLPEDATDEDIEKASEEVKEEAEKEPEAPAEEAKEEEAAEENSDVEEVKKENEEIKKELAEMKAEKIVGKALAEGKMLPKDRKFWMNEFIADPKKTAGIIDHLPVVVSLAEKGNQGEEIQEEDIIDIAKKIQLEERKLGKELSLTDCIYRAREENPKLGEEYEAKYMSDHKRRQKRFV